MAASTPSPCLRPVLVVADCKGKEKAEHGDEETSFNQWVGQPKYIHTHHGSDDDGHGRPISPDFELASDTTHMSIPRCSTPISLTDSDGDHDGDDEDDEDEEFVDALDHEEDNPSGTNVVVDERPTSTLVIIRPLLRRASGILSLLSRSSTTATTTTSRTPSPSSTRPSTPSSGTRPSSPLGFTFSGLKLNYKFHSASSDVFERHVDYIEEQVAREASGSGSGNGAPPLQVLVIKEVTVQREELWREGVQQVLYGQRIGTALRSRTPLPRPLDYHHLTM